MMRKIFYNAKKWAVLVFLGMFSLACTSESGYEDLTTYHISKTLEIVDSVTIKNSCFTSSFIIDDYVVFIAECDSHFFHVFDKHTLELRFKFGTKGRAPSEFVFPFPYRTNMTMIPEDGYYNFYDVNQFQIKRVNFNKLFQGDIDESVVLSQYMERGLYFSYLWNQLDEHRIAAMDNSEPQGLFFIYNTKTNKKSWVEYLHSFNMDPEYNFVVFHGNLVSNGELIFFASRYLDELLVFNNQGKLVKKYHFSPISMPKLLENHAIVVEDSPIYFFEMYGNTRACYALRLAMSIPEIEQSSAPCTLLFELDWNGEILHVYEMNFLPGAISICETSNMLYAILANGIQDDSITLVRVAL